MSTEIEREDIRAAFPAEYNDGARCGFLWKSEGQRELGGYPKGFNSWPLARRNAWYAGFNRGNCDRALLAEEGVQNG
jgi:hypothetical protein